ncbi:MAG: hypothetical protein ACI4W2_11530 [Eubacterium sp.]
MKLKETDGSENRFCQYPAYTVRGADANPQKIHEKLFNEGQGYKYAIVFDEMLDEFEDAPKETPVYYLDDILKEVMAYAGKELVFDTIEEMGWTAVDGRKK